MEVKNVSITMEKELVESIDKICEQYSQEKKTRYTRSQFITEACLFLMAYSNLQAKNIQENIDNKEEQ